MNKILFEQLHKVKGVAMPTFDEKSTCILIPRKQNAAPTNSFAVARSYLIKVENYIINPPNGFNLHDNWNKGIAPKHQYMIALIAQDIGKMIRVEAYGYDYDHDVILNDTWKGWLPKKSVTIIKEA